MSFCKSEASYLDDDYGGDVDENDDEAGDGGDVVSNINKGNVIL